MYYIYLISTFALRFYNACRKLFHWWKMNNSVYNLFLWYMYYNIRKYINSKCLFLKHHVPKNNKVQRKQTAPLTSVCDLYPSLTVTYDQDLFI